MAGVGRLRVRGNELVVEGTAGEILAKVEPDAHMSVDVLGGLFDLFVPAGSPRTIRVTWTQVLDEDRGYIDVDAVEVVDEARQLP